MIRPSTLSVCCCSTWKAKCWNLYIKNCNRCDLETVSRATSNESTDILTVTQNSTTFEIPSLTYKARLLFLHLFTDQPHQVSHRQSGHTRLSTAPHRAVLPWATRPCCWYAQSMHTSLCCHWPPRGASISLHTVDNRAFPVAALKVCNSLPDNIVSAASLCSLLKTFFVQCFTFWLDGVTVFTWIVTGDILVLLEIVVSYLRHYKILLHYITLYYTNKKTHYVRLTRTVTTSSGRQSRHTKISCVPCRQDHPQLDQWEVPDDHPHRCHCQHSLQPAVAQTWPATQTSTTQ